MNASVCSRCIDKDKEPKKLNEISAYIQEVKAIKEKVELYSSRCNKDRKGLMLIIDALMLKQWQINPDDLETHPRKLILDAAIEYGLQL